MKYFKTIFILLFLFACKSAEETRTLVVQIQGSKAGVVLKDPPGITCYSSCESSYRRDTLVTLTALPEQGAEFVGWSGCKLSSGLTCTIVIDDNQTVEALFKSAPFTVIAIPDTQYYSTSDAGIEYFKTQTNWIVEQVEARNIVFVTHEGDVTEHGDVDAEWERTDEAMDVLDGKVPYSVAAGDHDYKVAEDRSSGAEEFLDYFGPERYADYSWYGGSAPNGLGHYQFFKAGGYEFLHLNVEWEAPGPISNPSTPLGWARSILETYPNFPTIITTHSYLWDQGGKEGHFTQAEENHGDSSTGVEIFEAIIKPFPQVFMVLGGNFHRGSDGEDGEWHQVSINDAGLEVYEMLANYQTYANGGDGWLRILEFIPGGGAYGQDRIAVKTYSPTRDEYRTGERSQFSFDLDFATRFNP